MRNYFNLNKVVKDLNDIQEKTGQKSECLICKRKRKVNQEGLCSNCEKGFSEEKKKEILKNKKEMEFVIDEYPSDSYHFNNCILCGEETKGYAFCLDCYEALDRDDELCADIINSKIWQKSDQKNRCLLCNEETERGYFCNKCYNKYKNKTLFLEINNCKEIKINDSRWSNNIKTKDGHYVKSKDERAIADYLFEHKIRYVYEQKFVYNKNKDYYTPDFYLPDFFDEPVYIEYFGVEGSVDYDNKKEEKLKVYKEKGITVICLDIKDATKMEDSLNTMINKETIEYKKINTTRKN